MNLTLRLSAYYLLEYFALQNLTLCFRLQQECFESQYLREDLEC
jgi:hypothetical protein